MRQIITHFTDDDLYKFTMCCAVIENYPRTQVKYKFIDRNDTVYPRGFAVELLRQIKFLENVVITDEEISFMRHKCPYIPDWFYSFLKGFRYDSRWVSVSQDAEEHLEVGFEGNWSNTILLEVKVLAIISELYYMFTGLDKALDYSAYYGKSESKSMFDYYGLSLFGPPEIHFYRISCKVLLPNSQNHILFSEMLHVHWPN